MAIYAIGDLHLDMKKKKPMDVFGKEWENHSQKIKNHWLNTVRDEDVVLLAGDTSWAMHLQEVEEDLAFIDSLPGEKVIIKGNHDYWWTSLRKMKDKYPAFHFIQNNAWADHSVGVSGTRGWVCPGSAYYESEDKKIYLRELQRLELSLKSLPSHCEYKIVMLHYPPTNEKNEDSGFTELIEAYGVHQVIYGHLHGQEAFKTALIGSYQSTHYQLVSADYLEFRPMRLC